MSEFMDPRAAAEQEVRRRFEKERTDLVNVQRAQRRADLRDQKPVLDDLTRREDALREERRQALERIDREWQQERDRLGSRPLPAPAFGLAPSSAQNIRDAYVAAHERYAARREQARDGFDERQNDMLRERMETLHMFQTANQTRDRNFQDALIQLRDRQGKTFERLVEREMKRPEKSMRREFERQSHGREL
ncbi:MAG: hypothetical protein J0H94_09275 [Rhizobiales bacterium]|jgi:hypothetical protein|nr:hypothetical protein [Hyphomicrobiales bacterium]